MLCILLQTVLGWGRLSQPGWPGFCASVPPRPCVRVAAGRRNGPPKPVVGEGGSFFFRLWEDTAAPLPGPSGRRTIQEGGDGPVFFFCAFEPQSDSGTKAAFLPKDGKVQ